MLLNKTFLLINLIVLNLHRLKRAKAMKRWKQ